MQPQLAVGTETDHNRSIGMSDDPAAAMQAEQREPGRQLRHRAIESDLLPGVSHSPWSPPATDTATFAALLRAKEKASERWNSRFCRTQR